VPTQRACGQGNFGLSKVKIGMFIYDPRVLCIVVNVVVSETLSLAAVEALLSFIVFCEN